MAYDPGPVLSGCNPVPASESPTLGSSSETQSINSACHMQTLCGCLNRFDPKDSYLIT